MSEIKKLIPEIYNKVIRKQIKGHYFFFDDESWKEYQDFDNDMFRIVIANGYLAREMKCDKDRITYFHEWLMREEKDKFKEQEQTRGEGQIHVHHTTLCNRINIKSKLIVVRKSIHYYKIHGGYFLQEYFKGKWLRDKFVYKE